jgi:peptidoglycan/LPS O-acetylase OafA/YrhL
MKRKINFENLDGIRFLCFLSVFFYHSFFTLEQTIKDNKFFIFIKTVLFKNGNLGVNFFFVLSGFLITYLLIEEKKQYKKVHIIKFWIRRILRIWPLYFVCVFIGFIVFPVMKKLSGGVPNETANILYYITFTNNFDIIKNGLPDASILGVLWSIAIEEQFYFLWPFVLYFFPIKKLYIPFISIIIISIIFRIFNTTYILYEFHTLSCIGDMTIGAFGAWFIQLSDTFKLNLQRLNKFYIYLVYVVFVFFYLFKQNINYPFFHIFERIILSVVFIFIILEQCFCDNSFYKMKNFQTISKLGNYTYGLYCLHFIGILITLTLFKKLHIKESVFKVILLDTTLSLFITLIISIISYHFFENLFLKQKDKFSFFKK